MPIPKKYEFKPTTEEPYGWLSPGLRESLSDTIERIPENNRKKEEAKRRAAEKEAFMGNTKKPNLVQSAGKAIKNLPRNAEEIAENTMANLGVLSPANWIATGASAVDAGLGLIPGYQRDYDRIYLPTDKYNPRLSGISRVGGLFKGNPTVDEVAGVVTDFAMPGVFEYAMASAPRVARGLNALERGVSKIGRRTTKAPSQEFVTTATEAPPNFTYSYTDLPEDVVKGHATFNNSVSNELNSFTPIIDNNPVKKSAIASDPSNLFKSTYKETLKSGSTIFDYLNATDADNNALYPGVQHIIARLRERQNTPGPKRRMFQRAYNLSSIKVKIIDDSSEKFCGTWDAWRHEITINKAYTNNVDETLVHELEHAIQDDALNWDAVFNTTSSIPGMSTDQALVLASDYARDPNSISRGLAHASGLYLKKPFNTMEALSNMASLKSHKGWNMHNVPTDAELMREVLINQNYITYDIFRMMMTPYFITDPNAFLRHLFDKSTMLAPGALILPKLNDLNNSTNPNKN